VLVGIPTKSAGLAAKNGTRAGAGSQQESEIRSLAQPSDAPAKRHGALIRGVAGESGGTKKKQAAGNCSDSF
jgi:hypothetical protein